MAILSHVSVTSAVTVTTTTETVVAVSDVCKIGQFGNPLEIIIRGHLNHVAGTATTSVTYRVRQGSTNTGTLIGTAESDTLAAGNSETFVFDEEDTSGFLQGPNGGTYCVTIQQTGATGNGQCVGSITVETKL